MSLHETSQPSSLDSALLALCELNVLLTVQIISASSSDWWLCAHLADLAHTADPRIIESPTQLRQYLILDYAAAIVQIKTYVMIAIAYSSSNEWHLF